MPYTIATRRAADIGKMFAILMVIAGIFTLNILLLLVAFFIYIGASEEETATTVDICLQGVKVRSIMSSDVHTITSDKNLRALMDLMFREMQRGYPVVDKDVLEGMITLTDIQKVPDTQRDSMIVGQVMNRNPVVIGPDEEASIAMKTMTERGIHEIPVIENNNLVGIVSREDLVRAMELCSLQDTSQEAKSIMNVTSTRQQ
jgi:CBS domain-containing protein